MTANADTTDRSQLTDLPPFPWRRASPLRPPELYDALRDSQPVAPIKLATGMNAWLVTSYAAGKTLLNDRRASSDRAHPGFPYFVHVPDSFRERPGFVGIDPPRHTVHRKALAGEFTRHQMANLRGMVQRTVDERIDAMLDSSKPVDLVHELALPVPLTVICNVLGVPYSDHAFFHKHTRMMFDSSGTAEDRQAGVAALTDYLTALVEDKRVAPSDDLISRVAEKYNAAGLTDPNELVTLSRLLLNGGHESSSNMISLGTLAMLDNPEQIPLLTDAAPSLLTSAVEELLRFISPTDLATGRVALEDIPIGGALIREGDGIIIAGAAANHDPTVFAEPARLDLERDAHHHVSFGYGIHRCIGGPLAQMELEVLFPTLFQRIPNLRLAVPFDDLRFKDGAFMYGVYEMPVTW